MLRSLGLKGMAKKTKTVDLEWPISRLFLYLIRKWGRKGRVGGRGVSGGDGRSVEGLKRMA